MACGIGGEFRAPMAIAVIGGLLVSTGLSLVFVPAIFILMDDAQRLLTLLFRPLVAGHDGARTGPVRDTPVGEDANAPYPIAAE